MPTPPLKVRRHHPAHGPVAQSMVQRRLEDAAHVPPADAFPGREADVLHGNVCPAKVKPSIIARNT